MSVIPPKSSDFLAGSSLAFVKPMPKRGEDARANQGDSAEFDVQLSEASRESALELWRKLLPDPGDPSYSPTACAGILLGHFRIEEQIGRGGMGAVFRAVDTRLDREVALKVLAGTQSADSSSVDRFLNEARAAARLDHDNVARVFFEGEDRGLHFIAFEFIHGANVRQIIEARGNLSPGETVNYGLQIAHALRHIGSAGVVHRDVKPSNIIITPTGRAKLVDLGLARKVDPEASRDLTVDGTTLGTFDYISPEQAKNPRSVDIRSDIYSLGCTLYHMLTGEPPYPQGTMLQKLLDHQHKDVPNPSSRNKSIPPELSAVVRKMMASDPADRYASADELIADLSILAHAYGLRPTAPGSLVWAVPPRPDAWSLLKQNRAWIAAAVLLIASVFIIDRVQSDRSQPPSLAGGPAKITGPKLPEPLDVGEPPITTRVETMRPPPADVDRSAANGAVINGDLTSGGAPKPESLPHPSAQPMDLAANEGDDPADVFDLPGFDVPLSVVGSFPPFLKLSDSIPPGTQPTESPAPVTTDRPLPDEPPVVVPVASDPFVVRVENAQPVGFSSLEAACSAAPDGSSIELNFDGPSVAVQRPIKIVGKRLRLRRGAGRQPIIRFAVPADWSSAEVVRMMTVTRGSLEIYDVGFDMTVDPDFITDRWALLSLSQAEEVILRGVQVTVKNRRQHPASVLELGEPTSRFEDRMPEAMDRPPLRLEAEDCFFRGEADLILADNVDASRIRLSNMAIALDGALLHVRGMEAIDVGDINNERGVEFDLRHVTALLAKEMLKFDVAIGKSVPRVAVAANNCVFVSAGALPLVNMSGEIDPYDAQRLLEWTGDHSYVQTQDPVWLISNPLDERTYDLAEWNELWKQGRLDRSDTTNLLPRDRSLPFREMTEADLSLVRPIEGRNPAREGASDGTDAGVIWGSLRLPLPSTVP